MPTRKVCEREIHPTHGRGWRYYDQFGFDKWIIVKPEVIVVDWISRGLSLSVLTVFVPLGTTGNMDSPQWRETMSENWLKRAAAAEAAIKGDKALEDAAFEAKHQALAAFMLCTVGPDGKPRFGCRVSVFADDGHWKATLSDSNTEHSLYVTLERPQDAFAALDKALRAEQPDWRPWKKGGGFKQKGKKT